MKITIVEYTKKRKELVIRLCFTIIADALADKTEQELRDQQLIIDHIKSQLKNGIINREDIEELLYDPVLFVSTSDVEMLFNMLSTDQPELRIVK